MPRSYTHDILSGSYLSHGTDGIPSGHNFSTKEEAKAHTKRLKVDHPYGDAKHGEGPGKTLNRLDANKKYRSAD